MSPSPTHPPAASPRGCSQAAGAGELRQGESRGASPVAALRQGTGLLSAGKSRRLVPSFQRAEMGRYTSWEPERWEIPSPGASGVVAPHRGLGQGRMLHMHGDQHPQPNLAQKSLGIKENGQGKGDHKPQLLKKPVNGKKPLDLTCPDAFSLPVRLPAPAGRSSHRAGTAEVTSQLRWASPEAADGPSLSQN